MEETMDHIPLEDCKDGFIYRLGSRNLRYGIFNKETKGFTGIRTKFDSVFLFEEYHWDIGAPYGTAHPVEEIMELSSELPISDDQLQLVLFRIEYKKYKEEIWELEKKLMHMGGTCSGH